MASQDTISEGFEASEYGETVNDTIAESTVNLVIGETDHGNVPAQVSYNYGFNLDFSYVQAPKKPTWDSISNPIKLAWDLLDVRKYVPTLAMLTVVNSDVFSASLMDKFKYKNAVKEESGKAVEVAGRNIRQITADEVNAKYPKNYEPPYSSGTITTEFTTTSERTFVRVHGLGNRERAWIMEKSEIEGLTPEQIKDKFALPEIPTFITDVKVPEGTRMRMGEAGRNKFGRGEGIQYELLDVLDDPGVWQNTRKLGE